MYRLPPPSDLESSDKVSGTLLVFAWLPQDRSRRSKIKVSVTMLCFCIPFHCESQGLWHAVLELLPEMSSEQPWMAVQRMLSAHSAEHRECCLGRRPFAEKILITFPAIDGMKAICRTAENGAQANRQDLRTFPHVISALSRHKWAISFGNINQSKLSMPASDVMAGGVCSAGCSLPAGPV